MKVVQSGAGRCGSLSTASFEAQDKMICEDDMYPKVWENKENNFHVCIVVLFILIFLMFFKSRNKLYLTWKHNWLEMVSVLSHRKFPAAELNILSCHLFTRNLSTLYIL